MINLVLLTPGFPVDENDSTCIPPLQALVKELKLAHADEFRITVIAFQYPFIKQIYYWNGIKCFSAGGTNNKFPHRFSTWKSVMQFLDKIHAEIKIDIIHSFWLSECALIGSLFKLKTGVKHIAHAMGQDVRKTNKYTFLLKYFKIPVIANSDFAALNLKNNFNIRATAIIPFGINENDFKNISHSQQRNIAILGVGSLSTLKNFSLFIKIISNLKNKFPSIYTEIIGDGPEHNLLRDIISSERLQENVILCGKLSRNEVLKKMSSSKILLHTATFESAGYVFLEALRSGMKVVSFKTGFLPSGENSFACQSEDEMTEVIKTILQNETNYVPISVPLIAETANAIVNEYKVILQEK